MWLCPLFDFLIPAFGSQGFRHGHQYRDCNIGGHARGNGGDPILDRIFLLFFASVKLTSVRRASRAAGTNVLPIILKYSLFYFVKLSDDIQKIGENPVKPFV